MLVVTLNISPRVYFGSPRKLLIVTAIMQSRRTRASGNDGQVCLVNRALAAARRHEYCLRLRLAGNAPISG